MQQIGRNSHGEFHGASRSIHSRNNAGPGMFICLFVLYSIEQNESSLQRPGCRIILKVLTSRSRYGCTSVPASVDV